MSPASDVGEVGSYSSIPLIPVALPSQAMWLHILCMRVVDLRLQTTSKRFWVAGVVFLSFHLCDGMGCGMATFYSQRRQTASARVCTL